MSNLQGDARRKLLWFFLFFVGLTFVIATPYGERILAYSSEYNFFNPSPVGPEGGLSIPASCDSDGHDAPWGNYGESCSNCNGSCGCGTPAGTYDCSGTCVGAGAAPPTIPSGDWDCSDCSVNNRPWYNECYTGTTCVRPLCDGTNEYDNTCQAVSCDPDPCDGHYCGDTYCDCGDTTGNCSQDCCDANYGDTCTSAANNCGATTSGTYDCSGACDATPPADETIGGACDSTPNNCGDTNSGTIQCGGGCSATQPADKNPCTCSPNVGNSCSEFNSCNQSNTGTLDCNDNCSVSPPPDPPGYGNSCQSGANNCGQTDSGTIGCSGCNASTPADVTGIGDACQSCNVCGSCGNGTVQCSGCDAITPGLPGGYGSGCTSAPNNCGQTNSGTIGCSGCDASTPANVAGIGDACTGSPNNCGATNPGTITCSGCNATQPADEDLTGTCTSAPNNCGDVNIGNPTCGGGCDANPPADVNPCVCDPNEGDPCTGPANSCGDTNNGTIQCNGSCDATTPSERAIWNQPCISGQNICGMTNNGTTDCNGACNATTPPDSACVSGSISCTSCQIAQGGNSCSSTVSWSSNGLSSPRIYQEGTQFSTNANHVGISRTLIWGTNTFALYDNITLIDSTTCTPSCAVGTSWDGNSCEVVGATGSITAPNCTIPQGGSTCTSSISWTTTAAGSPAMKQEGVTFSNAASGTRSRTLNYGSNSFTLYNSATLLDSETATASCTGGTSWDGDSCEIGILRTITFSNNGPINSGQQATLQWDVRNWATCQITRRPAGTNLGSSFNGNMGIGSRLSDVLAASQTYRLTCNDGLATDFRDTTVAVNAASPTLNVTCPLGGATCCFIPAGASSCGPVNVAWTNATTPTAIKYTYTNTIGNTYNGTTVLSAATTGNTNVSIRYGNNNWFWHDPPPPSTTKFADCQVGSSWDGTICQAVGPLPDLKTDLVTLPVAPRLNTPIPLHAIVRETSLNADVLSGFSVTFYRNTTDSFIGAVAIATDNSVGPIMRSGSDTAIVSHAFPAATTYYVSACADSTGIIAETDNDNNCGPWTTVDVPSNNKPIANIITPNGVAAYTVGFNIPFSGEGSDFEDGNPMPPGTTSYEWCEGSCGCASPFGNSASFNSNALSVLLGSPPADPTAHTIFFRVRDKEGTWSDCDSVTFNVGNICPARNCGTLLPEEQKVLANMCPDQTQSFPDGCGKQTDACKGTRSCNFNWREVAP